MQQRARNRASAWGRFDQRLARQLHARSHDYATRGRSRGTSGMARRIEINQILSASRLGTSDAGNQHGSPINRHFKYLASSVAVGMA